MDKYVRLKYQPCLPLGKDGRRVTASEEHISLSREAASEGMILLKNLNNALPLKAGEKTALFGKATIEYIKGGGGSGDVNCPYVLNIFEGLAQKESEGKVKIFKPTIDYYKAYVEEESKKIPTQSQINKIWDKVNAMPFCRERDDITYDTFASMHVKESDIPDNLIKSAAEFAGTAIFTISRFSAEGTDRRAVEGDYYLSATEKRIIDRLTEEFPKVIIIINSGAIIDCEYFAENDKIQGLIMGWQGGMEGGMEGGGATADILCGDFNPCAKLPDTIAKTYDYYPGIDDFNESMDYLNYTEDIYVGYRYFDTIPGKCDYVRYPFGYGLSYTDFEISGIIAGKAENKITIALNVKNTGKRSGKEVIQTYYSAPQGKLGKPAKNLIAFRKTKLLMPGESETLALSFEIKEMASFDDLGKICKSAYVLEKGQYSFYIGNSSRNLIKAEYEYSLDEDVITEKLKQYCRPFKLEKRLSADGKYEKLEVAEPSYTYGSFKVNLKTAPEKIIPFEKVDEEISLDDFISQFTTDELLDFVGGQPPTGVANTGCFGGLKRLGIPAAPTADGPAGLRLNTETGIPTTAWPCASLLASTWNTDIDYKVGAAASAELKENNLGIWLAPAQNIHRNPLCGRNFEYFSEDPVLTGKSAASEIRGIQSNKIAVSVKHFACNNKEVNRFGVDSRISERALREIYLKGFEISVKEGKPWTIMSSYNLINGLHTSENWELLTGILRNEWGFDGMVTTDWGVKNDPVLEIKAGNDMKMHIGYPDDLRKGLEDGRINKENLVFCVKNILRMITRLA